MLAAAAREIGAGRLDQRVEPQSNDEFGSLVEAFNAMAGELATSRRKLERSTIELERKHLEVEGRRRYIETILERITTGVVSVDAAGAITTINGAAARLLGLERADRRPAGARRVRSAGSAAARRAARRRGRGDGRSRPRRRSRSRATARSCTSPSSPRRCSATSGAPEGVVLVLDDVTPLIRAQKVAAWREVARRLAHEIKNPLTPIQLCAERLRRHFAGAPPAAKALVDECTATIVGEVESLKGLVDEFSQFARMPAPRTVPTDLGAADHRHARALQRHLRRRAASSSGSRRACRSCASTPSRSAASSSISSTTRSRRWSGAAHDRRRDAARSPPTALVRVVVADDGPGIPAGEREKLFLPYYSTKRRGSGLGLAIVRRIIAEHGGSIDVGDNTPRGTRFTIELPC